ncbi:hypothetical protein PENTCL1PPCAC_15959, partial [Pristionchus entomophagus]
IRYNNAQSINCCARNLRGDCKRRGCLSNGSNTAVGCTVVGVDEVRLLPVFLVDLNVGPGSVATSLED